MNNNYKQLEYSLTAQDIDIALALALICGTILKMMPQDITNTIHSGILTPLLNTFMNLLSAIAGPMIFLAVVWGIYSIGDVSAFSALGSKLLSRLLIYISGLTIIAGLAIVLALNIILDFPETPIDIFGGDTMQILTAKQFGLIDEDVMRSKSR